VYNFPILSELILLLHWVLVTINDFLAGLGLGSQWTWGLAIIGLTIIVRLILFPLTWKQYKSAQHMQLIQPQVKALQAKYKNDRAKIQEETMKLYSEHRINPFASCLPLVLQLPVFIGLYAAIKGLGPLEAPAYQASVEALNQASFLWIPHLGQPDPYYILLVVYVVSQMISTELMVATQSDQMQKWIMRAMPIVFVLFLFNFPAGLFVYWVTTNVWTIGQQLVIRKTMPKPEELAARAKSKPKKRSRFMEAMMSSQQEAAKQREQRIAQKSGQTGAKTGVSGAAGGKKPAQGGKKAAPPGKGKRKPGQGQGQGGKAGQGGGKAGQAGAKPKGQGGQAKRPAGAQDEPAAEQSPGGPPAGGDQGANISADGPADD
jgi:YidC/Oxa1 family membrane protein insertase